MHHLQLILFLLLYISSQISDMGNGDDIQSFSLNVKIQKESTAKKNYSTQFSNSLLPTLCYQKKINIIVGKYILHYVSHI